MTEADNCPEVIDKLEVSRQLKLAVGEANSANPNSLGVIFFGSRTHNEAPVRCDSDVDLIEILQKPDVDASRTLADAIRRTLKPLGLIPDCQLTIYRDWIDGNSTHMLDYTKNKFGILDKDSIFITVDEGLAKILKELSGCQSRSWWKKGLMIPSESQFSS